MFSINALLYGNHLPLAQRCLSSIVGQADWALIDELRIGCNAVCQETREWLPGLLAQVPVPWYVYQEENNRNVGKYPLMRKTLHDPDHPIASSHILWLDDDSYLGSVANAKHIRKSMDVPAGTNWWQLVAGLAKSCEMLGSLYHLNSGFKPSQWPGIEAQPWYTGKSIRRSYKPLFATGGFWVCKREVLDVWDWPTPFLHHNGGDSLLGELCRQQDYSLLHFRGGVCINADAAGRESTAPRRGLQTAWAFESWKPGDAPDPKLHDFQVVVQASAAA